VLKFIFIIGKVINHQLSIIYTMTKINTNVLLGTSVIIAVIGLGLITSQLVYAQEITSGAEELKTLIGTLATTFTLIAGIAGSVVAAYAKMNQKLGRLKEEDTKKLLYLAEELKSTDQWSKEIVNDINAVVDVIDNIPEGKKLLKQKRVNLQEWNAEALKLNNDLDSTHKALLKHLLEK